MLFIFRIIHLLKMASRSVLAIIHIHVHHSCGVPAMHGLPIF
uniref:Uncharacterized protein n=1 Tax=Anguilla anguilla TaxID=7936 RepID=A0A0E9PHX3_ANGAN